MRAASQCFAPKVGSTPANSKDNGFIVGTLKLKLEAIEDHEASTCHKEKSALARTAAMRILSSLKTAQHEKLDIVFRTAHTSSKKGRPSQDYGWFCN